MDSTFASGVVNILDTKWSFSNSYKIQIEFATALRDFIGWDNEVHGRILDHHIVSLNTPDFSNSPIEVYTAAQYRIHNGKDELYRFSITFRDSNQMDLYRKFINAYRIQKHWYFDDSKMSVKITKERDYIHETDKNLMDLEGVLIEGVSNLDINNTNDAQVAEFTVKFKATSPSVQL